MKIKYLYEFVKFRLSKPVKIAPFFIYERTDGTATAIVQARTKQEKELTWWAQNMALKEYVSFRTQGEALLEAARQKIRNSKEYRILDLNKPSMQIRTIKE